LILHNIVLRAEDLRLVEFAGRRTHNDAPSVRTFETPDAYWDEIDVRRRYSIPHSDGSFFSDGSGYSNGPEADLHYEIIERLGEVALRLEAIDSAELKVSETVPGTNADFIPYAAEIEADIRLTRRALTEISKENVSDNDLGGWLETIGHLANKYLSRAGAICGIFFENAAAEGGKEFGKIAMNAGGIALSLYLAGVDFQGIATAISAFLALRNARN
jgi:hypothetical protein